MSTSSPSSAPEVNSYDVTPYPSGAFPQTHPNRLPAIARLFGVAAKSPNEARVLELGCADGSNLLPFAEQAKSASCIGVDSSTANIEAARKAAEGAGLKNVEFWLQDILDFPSSADQFDYIIVHGVYSWVPQPVREKILAICQAHLAENGIAYISYNAHPGWNLRRSLRDMMLFHTRSISDPKLKVQQARALLAFLAESVPSENNAYGMLLKNELNMFGNLADNYLLHDILGEENTPFYFHEFVSEAGKHGLQYLGEPNIAEMLTTNFSEKVRQTLSQLNNQLVAQEQYMDFVRNRSFRQTLLVRSGVPIKRNIDSSVMSRFAFRSSLVRATGPVELVPGVPVSFATAANVQITSADTFVKAVLLALTETKGVTVVSYNALLESARTRSRPFLADAPANRDEVEEATLQMNLLNLLAKGFVEIYAEPLAVRTDVPEKPVVTPLARYQALSARLVTNRMHQSIPADTPSRYIIAACDGTRTRDDLLNELITRVTEGKLQVNEGSEKVTDEKKLRVLLKPVLDTGLTALANAGFFAA